MAKKKIPTTTSKGSGLESLKNQLNIDRSPIEEEAGLLKAKKRGRPEGESKSSEFVDMSFKVTADFRKEFKTYAVINNISMKELLERAFNDYIKR